MPRPLGTIGETKLKILAVIYYNELHGIDSYGYNIWKTLKKKFRIYLDERYLRDLYHHLKDLNNAGLIKKGIKQPTERAPKRQLYTLTEKGKKLEKEFNGYLQILERDS